MIAGLYLSATGVLINSYRQDVIANNIANAETTGFKRDLALFQQRPTQAQETGAAPSETNALLEGLGGGIFASPTAVDNSQGEIETGGAHDVAIQGSGFIAVTEGGNTRLTRDGRLAVNSTGQLVLAAGGQSVLDEAGKPIQADPGLPVTLGPRGDVLQDGKTVGRIGLVDVADRSALQKKGGSLLSYGDSTLIPAAGEIRVGYTERSNVEPTLELTQLMDSQRQLEANANMIRVQDETLSHLVSDVGKVT